MFALQKDQMVKILPADQRNSTVIMNYNIYEQT